MCAIGEARDLIEAMRHDAGAAVHFARLMTGEPSEETRISHKAERCQFMHN